MDSMDFSNNSCEPMDLDMSMNSVNNLNESSPLNRCSTRNSIVNEYIVGDNNWNVRRCLVTIPKRSTTVFNFSFYFSLIILLLSILCCCNLKCAEDLDTEKIVEVLRNKVYGQQDAINRIMIGLSSESKSKLLILYGGTGVGKTYATSLILNDYWSFSNVYHYTMSSFKTEFSSNVLFGLIMCKTSFVVIDNLNPDSMNIGPQIKELIEKSENLGKSITIFLLLNCDVVSPSFSKKCDMNSVEDLKMALADIDALKEFIKFDGLKQEHLIKCIEDELGNKRISGLNMHDILLNFDVSADGCKGVYTKIKYLNLI